MSTVIFAECTAKCPPHALVALAGALVVGLVVGFLVGRMSAGSKAASGRKQPAKSRREARPSETRIPIPPGSVEIYVGNLSYDMTEDQLRQAFEPFGKVDTVRVVTNRYNDKSKGFGFVVMPNRPEAEAAIAALNDKEVMGRKMRVNEAKNTVVSEG